MKPLDTCTSSCISEEKKLNIFDELSGEFAGVFIETQLNVSDKTLKKFSAKNCVYVVRFWKNF